jgi:murein L,D-transpeptidase YcbB/YkuD
MGHLTGEVLGSTSVISAAIEGFDVEAVRVHSTRVEHVRARGGRHNRVMHVHLRRVVWFACAAALLTLGGCRKHPAGPPPPKPLSPESVALHEIAQRARLDLLRWPNFADLKKPVEAFYAAHDYEPVWVKGTRPTEQAWQMMAAFANCGPDALDPEDYDNSRWAARALAIHSAQDRAAFDMAMTVSAMRYLNDEHNGRVNPKRFNFGIDVNQKRYDLAKFLTGKIIHSSNVWAVLMTVPPQSNEYKRTLNAYRHWTVLATQDPGGGLPDVHGQLKPGDPYRGAQRMRELLVLDGDLPEDAPETAANCYDPALVRAVKHFQYHHGLQADGKIGPPTIAALNMPTAQRAHQLAIAVERWRWIPDAYQGAPVFVNLPEFKLRIYSDAPLPEPPKEDDGPVLIPVAHADTMPLGHTEPVPLENDHTNIALEMNVVVGKAGIKAGEKPEDPPEVHQTPMLVNQMRYLIFRPYWSVPVDITKREVLPGIAKNPDYLEAHEFKVVDRHQKPLVYTKAMNDRLLHGELWVRQGAGPENSLGLVKFMFPNQYSIYLHSTPAVGLFTRTRRDFSHGCVRVEKPVELASWILRDRTEWPADKIQEAMDTGDDNKTVGLKKTIPVAIFYATAYVEPDGTIDFTRDIYEYDKLLDETLAMGRPFPTKAITPVVDVHDER